MFVVGQARYDISQNNCTTFDLHWTTVHRQKLLYICPTQKDGIRTHIQYLVCGNDLNALVKEK